jgi:Tfp pilus assembly protein PilF
VLDDRFRNRRARSLLEEGKSIQLQGDIDKALRFFDMSIRMMPSAEAHVFRGWAYRAKRKLDDAIEECKKAIELDPEYGNPYNDIGSYLLSQGKLDDAIDWLERAKRAPRYDSRHFPFMNLGRVYAAKGLTLRALHEFEGALQLSPGDPTCLAAIAFLRDVMR